MRLAMIVVMSDMIVEAPGRAAGDRVTPSRYLGTGGYSESRSFEAYNAACVRCFIPSFERMCET